MEIKVREVSSTPEKSQAEVEQELLQKHEAQQEEAADGGLSKVNLSKTKENTTEEATVEVKKEEAPSVEEKQEEVKAEETPRELTDEDVLSHIKNRYNKEINSVDELFAERKESEPLPEDVSAYLKYRKETGRSFEDYVKLNTNFNDLSPDELLKQYLTATEEGLDPEDIQDLMTEYHHDDLNDESEVRKIKLAKKKKIAEAKKYFNKQKEYYKEPLESSGTSVPEVELEKLKAYDQSLQDAKNTERENAKRRDWFTNKTNEVFGSEFKGFEFNVNDQKITYSPGDVAALKKDQSSPYNFLNKYIGEDGYIKDAAGYHKALAIAMNPQKFASFFYEQGQSHATEEVLRKTKNINMSERKAPEVASKGGMKIRSVNPSDSGRGLKIKSLKRK